MLLGNIDLEHNTYRSKFLYNALVSSNTAKLTYSNNLSVECLTLKKYTIFYFVCKNESFRFSFSILKRFLSFSYLVALASMASTCWKEVIIAGILVSFLISEGKLSIFHHLL